jgi:predicted nicotinamide N-methyase
MEAPERRLVGGPVVLDLCTGADVAHTAVAAVVAAVVAAGVDVAVATAVAGMVVFVAG